MSTLNMWAFVLSNVFSCFVMIHCYIMEACTFLKRDGGGMDLKEKRGESGLKEMDGSKTVVRMYSMSLESIFNK